VSDAQVEHGGTPADVVLRERVDAIYRTESRRVLATLIRLLGDFDRAEEAMHDAFAVALERWQRDGVPANPRAWLISTARFRAIDRNRRSARLELAAHDVAIELHPEPPADDDTDVRDDQLRLIFTCCHPALASDSQVALTLREVCGLTTEEIAHAHFAAPSAVAQRIVRAKHKIRATRIPYQVPELPDLPDRLHAVLQVIYLVFNEGYSASAGETVTRHDLSSEAIRLARLLRELLPNPEIDGLLALMLLHESRRHARTTADGELVLLESQDRTQWNRAMITEGAALVHDALRSRHFGPYTLQAAIAAVHAESPSADATDWRQVVGLYDVLLRAEASPVIELNRAVAVALSGRTADGLAAIDALLAGDALATYHLAHAARADLCRRLGRTDDALASYRTALELTRQEPERRFLQRRIDELS
jgi:RNA polymerase sigma-70 factor, ECF subfamily